MICCDCEKDKPETDFYCYGLTPMKRCKRCYSARVNQRYRDRKEGKSRALTKREQAHMDRRADNAQLLRNYFDGRKGV